MMISDKSAVKIGWDVVCKRLNDFIVSSLGREQLRMMRPTIDHGSRNASLHLTDSLQRFLLQGSTLPLQDFIDVRSHIEESRPEQAMLSPDSLHEIRKVCRASRRIQSILSDADDKNLSQTVRPIVILRELEEQIESALDPNGRVLDSASSELRKIRRKLLQSQDALRAKLSSVLNQAIRQGYAAEHQLTMRAGRMVIPLYADAKRKIKGFVHDSSATGQTVYLEPAQCLELGNEVRILEHQEQREIQRILRELTSIVRDHSDAIQTNLMILGMIDLLHAISQLSIQLDGIVPRLSEKPILKIQEGKNPALCLTNMPQNVVPLTISVGEEYQTIVITGPNAGGKTVAMKSCGLMLMMLGCGIPVPVHPDSVFGMFNHILVEIGDDQSTELDLSTFSARIQGLKQMCTVASEGTLLLVDEIGAGTDPDQGAALAQAILEYFTASGAATIVTTHHDSLKVYAHQTPYVVNGSMDFDEKTLQPTFSFRQGVPGSSYALRIANRLGFNPALLKRARQILGQEKVTLESLIDYYREIIAKIESSQIPDASQFNQQEKTSDVRKRISAKSQPGKALPKPSVTFEVGQNAVIDEGNTLCEIISIEGRYARVAAGHMRMKVELCRLTPRTEKRLKNKGNVSMSSPKMRLDVRGYQVNEALSEVTKLLDQGSVSGLTSVEIIHGIGKGILRSAIHEYLHSSEVNKEFQCLDANPGVTWVKM
ncbi:MAG: Smr/MutS family protein [Bacteroidetes bacterium]|nr:Smr/MutS family protein [Bacteroidota bacterium]